MGHVCLRYISCSRLFGKAASKQSNEIAYGRRWSHVVVGGQGDHSTLER